MLKEVWGLYVTDQLPWNANAHMLVKVRVKLLYSDDNWGDLMRPKWRGFRSNREIKRGLESENKKCRYGCMMLKEVKY